MQSTAVLLACLACAGHGSQAKPDSEKVQGTSSEPMAALASLLAFNNPAILSGNIAMTRPTQARSALEATSMVAWDGKGKVPKGRTKKLVVADQDWGWKYDPVPREWSEWVKDEVGKPTPKLLERVQELGLLRKLAESGLLSKLESEGFFTKLEQQNAFSKAEELLPTIDDLEVLETVQDIIDEEFPTKPLATLLVSCGPLYAAAALLDAVPEVLKLPGAVLASVLTLAGLPLFAVDSIVQVIREGMPKYVKTKGLTFDCRSNYFPPEPDR